MGTDRGARPEAMPFWFGGGGAAAAAAPAPAPAPAASTPAVASTPFSGLGALGVT